MAKFDVNKKGYDVEQVDSFINKLTLKYEEKLSEQKDRVFSLKNEISLMQEKLENYKDKDKQISQALVYAVEKAEQIEGNASKLYDLEVRRLRLLYSQWQDILGRLKVEDLPKDFAGEIDKFTKTIADVLLQNSKIGGNVIRKDLHKNSNDYVRNILNKMDYAINGEQNQTQKKVLANMSVENEKESTRLFDLSKKLDKITVKGAGNMAENYLNSDEEYSSAYSRAITRRMPKKSSDEGFNLDDVLNPKEDLDEIMKAFDFFLEEHKDD